MTQANPFTAFQTDPFFNFNVPTSVNTVSNTEAPFGGAFLDLLEDEPGLAFQGALQRSNPTPNIFRQFQQSNFMDQFLGLQEQRIRQGLSPDLRFADFMGNLDFGREAYRTPPGQRLGGGTSGFAPRTRFYR